VLGLAVGALMGYYMLGSFAGNLGGWVFPYIFPWTMAFALVPGVILVALMAAWYPSSLALRTPLVEALAYE
jgi:ABC-type antimicrobial peptide transport system permease subunit